MIIQKISLIPKSMLVIALIFMSACSEESFTNISPEQYVYAKPIDLADGLSVTSLDELQLDGKPFDDLVKNILSGQYKSVDSVLIYKNDNLVLEEYFNGYNQEKLHDLRSATKSITSLLVGIAVEKGYIANIDESAFEFFTADYVSFKNISPKKREITLRHLLNMAGGLDCNDDDASSAGNEEKMYRFRDWYKFILDLEVINKPGEVFSYCTGGVNLLGGIIRKSSKMSINDFSQRYFFDKLAIPEYRWSYAANQAEDTGGHLFLRPRDMLKIGVVMLANGEWQSSQIVSSDWITLSKEKYFSDYGYLWWKSEIRFEKDSGLAPVSFIYASGNGGQKIYILPSHNAVIVFTGSNFNSFWGGYGPYLMMKDYILPNL